MRNNRIYSVDILLEYNECVDNYDERQKKKEGERAERDIQ